jgi:hypothetical protein
MSKRTEKKLRDLASLAYERALSRALDELSAEFKRWQNGSIDAFDLNQSIHVFHNQTGRKLYSFYVGAKPYLAVAAAVRDGILKRDEVGEELLSELSATINLLTRNDE